MTPEQAEEQANLEDRARKFNDLRLTALELDKRVEDLEKVVTALVTQNNTIMGLIEMLAARLGELVPDKPETDDSAPGEPGAYL